MWIARQCCELISRDRQRLDGMMRDVVRGNRLPLIFRRKRDADATMRARPQDQVTQS